MNARNLVLVVDDEEEVRDYLGAILEDAGFDVETAGDGDEALAKIGEHQPDFISLDLVMPNRSGMKLLYALRKNRTWSRIPVMIVTGHARDDLGKGDLDEILEGSVMSGPACYLEKPVRPDSYVRAIRRQMGLPEEPPAPTSLESVRSELKDLLDTADPVRLEAAMRALRGEGGSRPAEATPVASGVDLTGKRVLVVDDEPDVAEFIAAMLDDRGAETETAPNATEAMRRLRTTTFDLMTLDVDMPGKTGIRLYRDVKSDEDLRRVRVVVITGVQQEVSALFEGQRAAPRLDGYLVKPFQPEALMETIATALGV